jgi:hypothetical protein
VGAIFFNDAFYINSAVKIDYGQAIYSIIVTIIFDSILCVVLCSLIKSRVILLFTNLVILIVCLLLGSLILDHDSISNKEPFYYMVLICPQSYLTQINEMAFASTTYYYINQLPLLNGSVFNPFDNYYASVLQPYSATLRFYAYQI